MLESARTADREAVEIIAKQVHAMHVAWRPDINSMPDELYPADRFSEAVSARQLFVAKFCGIVVGYVRIRQKVYDEPSVVERKVLLLDEFAVHEAYRNKGFGTKIMEEVKALGRAFGCTDLQLGVYPQNDAAIAFLQKCGLMIRSIEMQMKI